MIDADALYNDICFSIDQMTDAGIAVDAEYLWGKLKDALDNAPTIEPKRGKWIADSHKAYKGDIIMGGHCSVCGYKNHKFSYNFCPYCGADMREREGE